MQGSIPPMQKRIERLPEIKTFTLVAWIKVSVFVCFVFHFHRS